jgi:hypothetical protein
MRGGSFIVRESLGCSCTCRFLGEPPAFGNEAVAIITGDGGNAVHSMLSQRWLGGYWVFYIRTSLAMSNRVHEHELAKGSGPRLRIDPSLLNPQTHHPSIAGGFVTVTVALLGEQLVTVKEFRITGDLSDRARFAMVDSRASVA